MGISTAILQLQVSVLFLVVNLQPFKFYPGSSLFSQYLFISSVLFETCFRFKNNLIAFLCGENVSNVTFSKILWPVLRLYFVYYAYTIVYFFKPWYYFSHLRPSLYLFIVCLIRLSINVVFLPRRFVVIKVDISKQNQRLTSLAHSKRDLFFLLFDLEYESSFAVRMSDFCERTDVIFIAFTKELRNYRES